MMPGKRKRTSTTGNERQSEEREESPAPTAVKRKRKAQYDPVEICQELYDTIRTYKNEEGRLICETFIRAPQRRAAADYYEVVTTPIDLRKIQQKFKMEEYEDIDQLTTDVELLVSNAKLYYKKSSQEYKDAVELLEIYNETKNDLLNDAFGETEQPRVERRRSARQAAHDVEEEEEEEELPTEKQREDVKDDPQEIEELFAAAMNAKDGERDISLVFQLLPQRSKYPEYYRIIKNPIDMKMIAQKIQGNMYNTLEEIEKDFLLMVKNARTFNEPKSVIYKDAVEMKRIVQKKKQEIIQRKSMVPKPPERVRTRNLQKMSTICAALKYPSDEEEDFEASLDASLLDYDDDSGAETIMSEDDSLNVVLLNAVKNYKLPSGETIFEPFVKLPSKRFYPDYYEEIAKPMSLSNVRKKIKFNQYRNLDQVAADLNQVFDNAKQYNADDSLLYQHAVMLQKTMNDKKRELDRLESNKDLGLDDLSPSQFDLPVMKISREFFDEDSQASSSSKHRRSAGLSDSDKKRAKRATPEEMMKRRLWTLYRSVFDAMDQDGRPLRYIFMQLPLKRDYPDYYQVIANPIDLSMIEAKLRADKYPSEQHIITDFERLFNNARLYNEEDSQVYQDAEQLERVLKTKWKQICHVIESRRAALSKRYHRLKAKSQTLLPVRLQEMYDAVSNYQDPKGRELAVPFLKLPLKTDYPDYYEVIKKPVDMQKILLKMQQNQYESIEDMTADFVQMFDNACKYNEPDSLIYKDALTLQRLVLEKKMELADDGTNDVPDVRALVMEMMTNLFISTYNHQDEEGRCYSDSFAELPERDPDEDLETSKKKEKPLSFDQIKRNVEKARYVRMDRFQEDMFNVFERARRLSRTDSQLYEDAVEMQMFFIKKRDEICRNGERLLTPALSYQEKHLTAALEFEKQTKFEQEQKEDEGKQSKRESEERILDSGCTEKDGEDCFKYKDETFRVGDFVYIEPREKGLEPHIMCIEKMYTDSNAQQQLHGNWFYRPNETFHLASRKFLEKEVFKSDFYTSIQLTQVIGKCYVMYVKEYFKSKPEGFDNKDVFVCESRYSNRHKSFKKIKVWQIPAAEPVPHTPREIPLVPVRVSSVFASRKEEEVDDGDISILDKDRIDVPVENSNPEDGYSYYEQLRTPYGTFKIGDSVYLKNTSELLDISRIEKIFVINNDAYFTGTAFVRPADIPHSPTRLFYRHELFLSSQETVHPISQISGRCCVLHLKEYCISRVTEISEEDTFLCESKIQEMDKTVKRLGKGLKKYNLSGLVTDDEVFFYKKPITPQKEPSPLLLKAADEAFMDDSQDSTLMDTLDESTNMSFDTEASHQGFPEIPVVKAVKKTFEDFTPVPEKSSKKEEQPEKKKKGKNSMKRQISGYIVYSGEIRKIIQHENPECTFGEISRIVGGKKNRKWRPPSGYILFSKESRRIINAESPDISFGEISRLVGVQWRNLSKEEKEKYEERAKRVAEEQLAKQQEATKALNDSLQGQGAWDNTGGKGSPAQPNRPGTPGSIQGQHQGHAIQGLHNGTPRLSTHSGMSPGRQYMPPYHGGGTPTGMRAMTGGYPSTPQSSMPGQHMGTPQGSIPPYSVTPRPPTQGGGVVHPNMCYSNSPSSLSASGLSALQEMLRRPFNSASPGVPVTAPTSLEFYPPVETGQQMAPPPPPPPPPRPPSPMFVSVPPRTHRLLHSEAYLRYIEGLRSDKLFVSEWDKNLTANAENTNTDPNRLPSQWLAEGPGYHGNVSNALWALRDLMLKDTLNISRTLPFDAL
ncbi:LOW QUALITY PROTEIN: protein polybromo-1-like [Ostrea edulis]|uniref:LOW QUALITY PROTEIN: protein polybromo-1-like n=1 Tax=Ostrea edulis TaxID=37623 RepID=UPI0020965E73|nr:LOW QUALITY PROTEIN: protein polybromo-1-like [Ostrea edulis]